ncbi:MAG: hypothetical protein QOJ89_5439 [bacterium]
MPTLGCSCNGTAAHFALMTGDSYVDDPLKRIQVADILDRGERLVELRDRIRVELERINPDAVALLGSISQPRSYNVAAERATVETIVRIAAQELGLTCERLSPPTVLARLGLGRSGTFDLKARSFFAEEHPPYWSERCKAALVAVAWQRA